MISRVILTRSRFVQITSDCVRRYAALQDLICTCTDLVAFEQALETARGGK